MISCADRPDATLTVINVPALHRIGYNLKNDYDDTGNLKADAKPTVITFSKLEDLNKLICTDDHGLAEIKSYTRYIKKRLDDCEAQLAK